MLRETAYAVIVGDTLMKGLVVMRARIVLYDGFDPLDAIAPYEVLWVAGAVAP